MSFQRNHKFNSIFAQVGGRLVNDGDGTFEYEVAFATGALAEGRRVVDGAYVKARPIRRLARDAAVCACVVAHICEDIDASPFLAPVPLDVYPTYTAAIAPNQPNDLGTVLWRLDLGSARPVHVMLTSKKRVALSHEFSGSQALRTRWMCSAWSAPSGTIASGSMHHGANWGPSPTLLACAPRACLRPGSAAAMESRILLPTLSRAATARGRADSSWWGVATSDRVLIALFPLRRPALRRRRRRRAPMLPLLCGRHKRRAPTTV